MVDEGNVEVFTILVDAHFRIQDSSTVIDREEIVKPGKGLYPLPDLFVEDAVGFDLIFEVGNLLGGNRQVIYRKDKGYGQAAHVGLVLLRGKIKAAAPGIWESISTANYHISKGKSAGYALPALILIRLCAILIQTESIHPDLMYFYPMRTILRHLLLWAALYIVYTYMMSFYEDYKTKMLTNLVNVSLFMVAYYLLRYVQIPYLYNRDRMVAFGLSILASSFTIGAICRINGILWMDELNGKTEYIPFMTAGSYLLKTVRYYTPAMAILAWESHQKQRKEQERMQQLEKEKIANELKFLKAQINPHFLFNTLNNLYSYVLNQSPKAPDMVMRLSGMLDYVLYKSQQERVMLAEEVNTIEHFLELEQIRYGSRLQVDYNTGGDLSLTVSPLILLSVVENAFKHGASGDIDNPRIQIDIWECDGQINCEVWNTKSRYQGDLTDAYKESIGLSNIRRQLNLIYPGNHDLTIYDRKEDFKVALTITPPA